MGENADESSWRWLGRTAQGFADSTSQAEVRAYMAGWYPGVVLSATGALYVPDDLTGRLDQTLRRRPLEACHALGSPHPRGERPLSTPPGATRLRRRFGYRTQEAATVCPSHQRVGALNRTSPRCAVASSCIVGSVCEYVSRVKVTLA